MATVRIASATSTSTPTLSWSQVMNVERFILEPSEEIPDVAVVARGHLLRRAEENDVPLGQQRDARRHAEGGADVVRDDDARDAELALELHDQPRDGAGRQ